ncbi:MAG: helix-turn-helix transcriptional regulator [Bacteroidales bacterium]|nr:helix-turn-helix transcriptional regulator [Bacteroidales bacterium]
MNPCFAIIDQNTLSGMALRGILWDIFDLVEVYTYNSVEEFIKDSNRHFVHFFVSSDILFNEVDEFEPLKEQTTVMSAGPNDNISKAGFRVLDVSVTEQEVAGQLLQLDQAGHCGGEKMAERKKSSNIADILSVREKSVLTLMVKGLINKEIADELGISTPTVIFHRNNICEKLQTRSIGKLTVLAVLSGIVDINDI